MINDFRKSYSEEDELLYELLSEQSKQLIQMKYENIEKIGNLATENISLKE